MDAIDQWYCAILSCHWSKLVFSLRVWLPLFILGTNRIQLWLHVNIPQLLPAATAILVFRIRDAFKAFDTILIMTMGGPGRTTQVLNLTAYLTGFRFFDLGKAAALGIIALIMVVALSQLLVKVLQKGN